MPIFTARTFVLPLIDAVRGTFVKHTNFTNEGG